jgi:hypothetical protein
MKAPSGGHRGFSTEQGKETVSAGTIKLNAMSLWFDHRFS